MPDTDEYAARAAAAVMRVLEEHHAVVHPELEARIAEANFAQSRGNIDPHHITNALRDLRDSRQIEWAEGTTRGGHTIETIQLTNTRLRATKTTATAARKRLLYARYTGWAQGTKRHPQGLIGPAGEAAVRSAILASGAMQPAVPDAGEVSRLFGVRLPGPVDSAGYLVGVDPSGVPQPPVTVLVEVKNIRSWVYPGASELYQLLHKALLLHQAQPQAPLVPVFVCRRAHPTTFWMAKQLGFVVIDMNRQYAGDVGEQELLDVRNELHFNDLYAGAGPSLRVRDRFTKVLPRIATTMAAQWSTTAATPELATLLEQLRAAKTASKRNALTSQLRAVNTSLGARGGW